LGFETNNSIPNINDKYNQIGFIYYENKSEKTGHDVYSQSTVSYDLSEMEAVIKHVIADTDISFELKGNSYTLKCEMLCNVSIDLSMPNNIGSI